LVGAVDRAGMAPGGGPAINVKLAKSFDLLGLRGKGRGGREKARVPPPLLLRGMSNLAGRLRPIQGDGAFHLGQKRRVRTLGI